jgi:hypothetical protein
LQKKQVHQQLLHDLTKNHFPKFDGFRSSKPSWQHLFNLELQRQQQRLNQNLELLQWRLQNNRELLQQRKQNNRELLQQPQQLLKNLEKPQRLWTRKRQLQLLGLQQVCMLITQAVVTTALA